MTRWAPILANLVLFDVLWTLAVLGAGKTWWWAAPALILVSASVQVCRSPAPGAEARLIILGAAAGVVLDCSAHALGLFRYASPSTAQFVAVFAALWVNFGTLLRPGLRWLWRRPLLAALLGGAGGPLTYWTAARLGAIAPSEPAWRAFAWCAAQYALALPLWCAAASAVFRNASRSVHPATSIAPPRPPGTQGL